MSENRLEKILKLSQEEPQNSFLLYALALEYEAIKSHEEAIRTLEKLKAKDPEYLGLYYTLSTFYIQKGELERAEEIAKEGIQIALLQQNLKTKMELQGILQNLADDE